MIALIAVPVILISNSTMIKFSGKPAPPVVAIVIAKAAAPHASAILMAWTASLNCLVLMPLGPSWIAIYKRG